MVLALAGIVGAVIHSAGVTSGSRLGSIALFVVIGARIVRSGPMRILALVTLALIVVALFGGELLDPIGVPGIWFPFGIGVSRTQYVYAIAIPLLAFLIVRTLVSEESASRTNSAMLTVEFGYAFDAQTPIKIRYFGVSNYSGWHLMKLAPERRACSGSRSPRSVRCFRNHAAGVVGGGNAAFAAGDLVPNFTISQSSILCLKVASAIASCINGC